MGTLGSQSCTWFYHYMLENLQRVLVYCVEEICWYFPFFISLNEVIIKTNLCLQSIGSRYPMDSTLYLAVSGSTTSLGVWIIGTMQLHYLALSILNNFLTFDNIAMLQTNLALWLQAEELLWGILHKVLLLNVQLTAKWHIAVAALGRMVLSQHIFLLALWIVGDNYLQWVQDSHNSICIVVQIISDAMLQHSHIYQAISLGYTYLAAEIPQGSRSITTTAQSRNSRHTRIIPSSHIAFLY